MKYEIIYNRARKEYVVWAVRANGNAEAVKRFKSEQAAKSWAAKH